ncbi:MAG: hypothetical protein ACR2PK_16115 [Acidimicrobiales bacterium]
MEAQQSDWVDAIRYFRGLGRSRRIRPESIVVAVCLLLLLAVTVLAVIQQFA